MPPWTNDSWKRKGFSFLWEPSALQDLGTPQEMVSLRQLFQLRAGWPEALPSQGGNALVVTGLDGLLSCLDPKDAEVWLKGELWPVVEAFQRKYEGEAALIFWLPGARNRVIGREQGGGYNWTCDGTNADRHIHLTRSLFGGADRDIHEIQDPRAKAHNVSGTEWWGLHLRRIS